MLWVRDKLVFGARPLDESLSYPTRYRSYPTRYPSIAVIKRWLSWGHRKGGTSHELLQGEALSAMVVLTMVAFCNLRRISLNTTKRTVHTHMHVHTHIPLSLPHTHNFDFAHDAKSESCETGKGDVENSAGWDGGRERTVTSIDKWEGGRMVLYTEPTANTISCKASGPLNDRHGQLRKLRH